jgi:hypothetical protein
MSQDVSLMNLSLISSPCGVMQEECGFMDKSQCCASVQDGGTRQGYHFTRVVVYSSKFTTQLHVQYTSGVVIFVFTDTQRKWSSLNLKKKPFLYETCVIYLKRFGKTTRLGLHNMSDVN